MAFNGSGTYNLPSGNPVVTGTTISSTWANTTLSDIASALTNCITRDGQSPATGNIPMGNYKLTGIGSPTTTGDALVWGSNATIAALTLTTALTVANGGTGAATLTGLIKGNGTSAFTAAVSGTDYAPATSGSSILKGNGSGGFSSATSGTDYAPATSGSAILKGNGAGGFSNAASGTDYAPATSGTGILKGNGSGGFSTATGGTDYQTAQSVTGLVKSSGTTRSAAVAGTDYVIPSGTVATATNATNILGNSGQTWQSVSRAFGTTYTNSTGKPIMVLAIGHDCYFYVSSNYVTSFGSGSERASYVVPISATYRIDDAGGGSVVVYELR